MPWYLWLYIVVAVVVFLVAYNQNVLTTRENGLYLLRPTKAGQAAVIYILDPIMAALWAALWPLLFVVLSIVGFIYNVRSSKKPSRD